MAAPDMQAIIDAFWKRRQEGVFYPPEWEDKLTVDEAYPVQLGILDHRVAAGERHVGWKVGLTSLAMQEQFRVHEPAFGYLVDAALQPSGVELRFDSLTGPAFENEICMTLGSALAGPGVTEADAAAAVTHVQSALEIVETRGDFTRRLPLAVADNIQQRAIVLGPKWALADAPDLATVTVRVTVNGAEVGEGRGDAVLGHPMRSLAWLANKLAEFGRRLEAGQVVMTGSLTRQFPLAKGDCIAAAFDALGEITASFP